MKNVFWAVLLTDFQLNECRFELPNLFLSDIMQGITNGSLWARTFFGEEKNWNCFLMTLKFLTSRQFYICFPKYLPFHLCVYDFITLLHLGNVKEIGLENVVSLCALVTSCFCKKSNSGFDVCFRRENYASTNAHFAWDVWRLETCVFVVFALGLDQYYWSSTHTKLCCLLHAYITCVKSYLWGEKLLLHN